MTTELLTKFKINETQKFLIMQLAVQISLVNSNRVVQINFPEDLESSQSSNSATTEQELTKKQHFKIKC